MFCDSNPAESNSPPGQRTCWHCLNTPRRSRSVTLITDCAWICLPRFPWSRPMVGLPTGVLPPLSTKFGLHRLPSTGDPHPGWPSAALTVVAAWGYRRLPTLSGARRVTLLVAIGAIAGLVFAFKQNAGVLL